MHYFPMSNDRQTEMLSRLELAPDLSEFFVHIQNSEFIYYDITPDNHISTFPSYAAHISSVSDTS